MKNTFRVFTDDEHEYNIIVDEEDIPEYLLIRTGLSWSEDSRGEVVLRVTNDGNGYHFPKIGKKMDYAEMAEWSILVNFINWYESRNTSNNSVISIEICNEVVKFTI